MDSLRIGTQEPVSLQAGAGEKLPDLKPGDVVRAQVVRVPGRGALSLRMGNSLIQATTADPLPHGATLLFRVLGRENTDKGGAVRLQLIQQAGNPDPAQATMYPSGPAVDPGLDTIRALAREYAARAPFKTRMGGELLTTVRDLLKALPDAPSSLPRELRLQLLDLLRTSLRETEQSIQNRARLLFGDPRALDLNEQSSSWPLPELTHSEDQEWTRSAGLPLFAEIESILSLPLQSVLADTGVTLEAKLKALAQTLLAESTGQRAGELPASFRSGESAPADSLSTDFKARLLQLRERILEQEPSLSNPTSQASPNLTTGAGEDGEIPKGMLPVLDGLLRDIETFQLLSKLTQSFYTFLPFLWRGLKEGDIALKRGRGTGGEAAHYCVMNLDMESLGNVTIVAVKQNGDFFVSFKTDHQGLRAVLDENVETLRGMFREAGLNLREIDFHDGDDPSLAPFMRLESFESVLDLKI